MLFIETTFFVFLLSRTHQNDQRGREREACTLRIHEMCIHIQIVRVEASAKIVCLIFSFLLLLLLLLQLLSISVYLFWLIQHDYVTFFRRIFFCHNYKFIFRRNKLLPFLKHTLKGGEKSSNNSKRIIGTCLYVILFIRIRFVVFYVHFDRPQPHFQ